MPTLLAFTLLATAGATTDGVTVAQLVDRFNAARAAFADTDLAATLAPDYQEISPVGDVDSRAEVLSFYRPDKRTPVPAMTGSDRNVALHGTWGIVTERLSFAVPKPDGTTITRSIRVRYVAARGRSGWQLVSAQYTGMPAAR
ncbi:MULTISPECIES: DUF4440 domain-containing protein [Sphingomonas]|uniref:DUF4440 domain-containing protein n=1 Tax=Sphingomonas TaxID=13687 RepID=UPI001AED6C8A|nr:MULTISPECIES: DUF4440 domain-containing protein [Sphingomonas]